MSLSDTVVNYSNLHEDELARYVISATKEVFETMVMMELEDQYPLREPITKLHCSITGMVGLAGHGY